MGKSKRKDIIESIVEIQKSILKLQNEDLLKKDKTTLKLLDNAGDNITFAKHRICDI